MEGPSLHVLAKKLHIFLNQTVYTAFGNARFSKKELIGQTIKDIYPFGKRLIIQLEKHAIVCHFLLYGSYRIDAERENLVPRLAVQTQEHTFFFYNCSVKCAPVKNLKKDLPLEYDILSPYWDVNKIVSAVQQHPQETIDDVLLDQEIFAGVGNIIKNETLALSYVKPDHTVAQLSRKKIKEVATHAHSFSHYFLKYLEEWPRVKKNFLVYGKKYCGRCATALIRKQTGKRNRRSFICPHCQK